MTTGVSAEEQTKTVLLASVDLAALVGTRIYADELPEGQAGHLTPLPAIAYERAGTFNELALDNTVIASKVSIQITVWALSRSVANEIAKVVELALLLEGIVETERSGAFNDALREYGVVMLFDVWET